MKFFFLIAIAGGIASAHDIITTPITWTREISRIVYAKCASCHREGGSSFSLMTFQDVRPWAVAIREEALRRSMPPWGAVKGFGDFRNDQALTPEQMELIVNWTEGGVPEGEDKLPDVPRVEAALVIGPVKGEIVATGTLTLKQKFTLDGMLPKVVPPKASFQIVAELPDGSVEPLLWLQDYQAAYGHPFLLRKPLVLPAGTVIRGVPAGASVRLLPPTAVTAPHEH
ncbi:MAG: cytochrome c [Acidobacteriota bacterium]